MDQEKLRKLIEEILQNTRELSLATAVENIPWCAVLVFGHDKNLNLYWVSYENARHSVEIEKNKNVAATITMQPTGNGQDKGLQIQGEARKLKEEEILGAAREYFAKRGTDKMPKTVEDVNKLLEGRSWYTLKPTKMFVLCAPLFNFDRKEYTL